MTKGVGYQPPEAARATKVEPRILESAVDDVGDDDRIRNWFEENSLESNDNITTML